MRPDEVLNDFIDTIHAESERFINNILRPHTDGVRQQVAVWSVSPMPKGWGRYRKQYKPGRRPQFWKPVSPCDKRH